MVGLGIWVGVVGMIKLDEGRSSYEERCVWERWI